MKPSGRPLSEVFDNMRESFFKKNGYYATEEDAIRLVKEARQAIRAKKEEAIRLADETGKATKPEEDVDPNTAENPDAKNNIHKKEIKHMTAKYELSVEENIFVARRNIVDYIWKSAKLKGLDFTFPEISCIYDNISVANASVTDIIIVNNLKHGWYFLFDTIDVSVDLAYICHINRIVNGNNHFCDADYIRTAPETISGTSWMPDISSEQDIKDNLAGISEIESPTERSIVLMLYLMRAQIFIDGNTRTAMLAANHEMIKNGCGIISIPIEFQMEFKEQLVRFYETNDMESIKKFVFDNCIDGLDLSAQRNILKQKEQAEKRKK